MSSIDVCSMSASASASDESDGKGSMSVIDECEQ